MIDYKQLTCHNIVGGCSVVDDRCSFMNQCSSHGTCQSNGQCVCDANWKSADCSMPVNVLLENNSGVFNQYGPKYFSFSRAGSTDSILTLTSDNWPMEIWIKEGADSNPTQFDFDIHFNHTMSSVIRAAELGLDTAAGYSITLLINAYNETANTYYNNSLTADFSVVHATNAFANRVCVTNMASFTMKWWLHDVTLDVDTDDSGSYGYQQTRCQNIVVDGISENDAFELLVHPIGGSTNPGSTPITYQSSFDITASYTCSGDLESYECSLTGTSDTAVLMR